MARVKRISEAEQIAIAEGLDDQIKDFLAKGGEVNFVAGFDSVEAIKEYKREKENECEANR